MNYRDVMNRLEAVLKGDWESKGDLDSDQLAELSEEIASELDSIAEEETEE
jgi:hypothetical protein